MNIEDFLPLPCAECDVEISLDDVTSFTALLAIEHCLGCGGHHPRAVHVRCSPPEVQLEYAAMVAHIKRAQKAKQN